jgi:GT2 family glycosyltransferase
VRGVPEVSVVVSTRDRAGRLAGLVAALEGQRCDDRFEVVVVDDGSRDGTWEALQGLASSSPLRIVTLRLDRSKGPAAGRNVGWREASAPLVAFTDDDCTPGPGWLAALVEALADADVVQGLTLPDPAQLPGQGAFGRTVKETEEGLYPTCNVGYRRSVLERLGGFDEFFGHQACEDTDLAWRAREDGARTRFAPDALVLHDVHPSSYRAYLREKLRWTGVPLVVRRHPGLRRHLHQRWVWRASHLPALSAAGGMLLGAFPGRRRVLRLAAGAALSAPYLRFRTRVDPLPCGPRRRLLLLPAALAADLFEVAVVCTAAARHRCLVL